MSRDSSLLQKVAKQGMIYSDIKFNQLRNLTLFISINDELSMIQQLNLVQLKVTSNTLELSPVMEKFLTFVITVLFSIP